MIDRKLNLSAQSIWPTVERVPPTKFFLENNSVFILENEQRVVIAFWENFWEKPFEIPCFPCVAFSMQEIF